MTVTQARLRELLEYDPVTGVFRWRYSVSRRVQPGSVAGYVTKRGYVEIRIDGRGYHAQRLAWLYVYGEFPTIADHRDLDKGNNAIGNIRNTDGTGNNANVAITKRNTSGFKGVMWSSDAGKWRANIGHRGKKIHLGFFATPEEAHEAYRSAARERFGEFARVA